MESEVKPLLARLGRVLLSLGLLAALFNAGQTVHAQSSDTLALSISPLNFEFTINPGESREDVVKVTNPNQTKSLTVTMSVDAFKGDETGQATVIEDEEADPAYSLKQWVTATPKTFTLKPQESRLVTFKTVVPRNAEPGGKYGAIVASTDRGEIGQTGAATVQRVGALVLLTVQGAIKYDASPRDFYTVNLDGEIQKAEPKSLHERGPVRMLARIHNEGTVHIKPKGFVTVSNLFGKKVADLPFPERNVLPNSDRVVEVKWDDVPMGRYTATLVLNYGDKGDQITSTTSFTVFPWKIGVPVIAGVLIILWFLIARRKRLLEALAIIFGRR